MRREGWPRVYLSGRVLHSACALIPSCSNQTSNSLISVHQCHPWIGNADTHSTWRNYNRVAITHLLHRRSQKRTYYNKYGLRPSNMITSEGLEDKVSPSTPTTSLSERPRPKAPYSSSEKSATWYVAARKWASTWNVLAISHYRAKEHDNN